MAIFGIGDTSSYIDWPINVDATYLRGLTTRSGLGFPELVGRLEAGLGAINSGFDPLVASLVYPTTSAVARGARTGGMQVQKRSQYTLARPQMTDRLANMLPIDDYEIALGFTEDGLRDISLDEFQTQVDGMVEAWERHHRRESLARLFSDAEVPVAAGTTATSPGMAGSGTGANAFTAMYPDGSTLPGGYTHYFRDTVANRAAVILTARDRLRKWAAGPYDLVGSETAIAAIVALGAPNFVAAGSVLVRPAQGTAEAMVDAAQYVGVFGGDIRVHVALNDFTDDVVAIYKSYGALNPNNALGWRWDEQYGRAVTVRSRELFPLAEAVSMQRFGVGVSNRTAAALIRFGAAGAYTAPTFG